jgi:hypothetical protein
LTAQFLHRTVKNGSNIGFAQVRQPGDLAVVEASAVLEGDQLALAVGQVIEQAAQAFVLQAS